MAKNGSDGELRMDKLPDPGGRYELGPKIASGMLSEVFEAVDKEAGGKKVAVKVVPVEKDTAECFQEEHRVLKDMSHHPNIPDFYGVYLKKGHRSEPDQLWFVMELCEGGPVIDLVRHLQAKNRRMSEEHIAYVLKETIKALVNFHECHVMHRDVKSSNILLTKEGEVKLVGFQLSRKLRNTMDHRHTFIGSPCWIAPEVITSTQREGEGAGYDSRVDVWALGITAIELGDGKAPFQDMHPTRALFQIVRNPPPTLYRPANWSQMYNDFITECLEKNPEHRPFVVELMEHPFITSVPENDYHLSQELKALLHDKEASVEGHSPELLVRGGRLKTGPGSPLEDMRVEDLAALEDITEDAVLAELEARMRQGHFHTFVGDVLLVLNPNERQDVYGQHFHRKYQSRSRSDNEPHIFAVADRAYQDVLHHEEPQHILLGGESLSGKTANLRHLLRHLCFLGKGGSDAGERVENALGVVHALANAATPINPDSTRHLLQLEVTFSSTGKVSGAIFWLLQLEKWRVSSRDRHQANFHVFYYFYDAMEAEGRLDAYRLDGGRGYRYLRTAREDDDDGLECARGPREDPEGNVAKFLRLRRDLAALDFGEEQQKALWRLVAAVLALGEVTFRDVGDNVAEVANPEVAAKVAWLLGLEEKKFVWALTNYCVVEKGTAIRRRHTASQAEEARDALANGLYFRLVDWVVNVVNLKLSFTRAVYGDKYSISIMDLFGFECFKKNSLEQLFVNTINEQLQYHYTQRMFVWEMQEQEEEEIPLQTLQFYDNKPTVDELMSKPNGLLYLLDEASRSSRGSDLIIDTLKRDQLQGRRLRAIGRQEFTVAHYTGKVTYGAQLMADKNRDFLPPEMIETLRLSSDRVLQKLFTNQLSRTGNLTLTAEERGDAFAGHGKGRWGAALVAGNQPKPRKFNTESHGEYSQTRKMRTAAAVFRGACLELLRGLSVGAGSGGTHFVRCLRTDLTGQPRGFQHEVVRQQVRALAVLETARARQKGYPHRVPFPEFIRRYKFLAFDFNENVEVTKENCRLLLIRLKMEGWVIGKSKVFLKYYNEEYLSRTYESQVKKIIKVQTMMRAFLAKKNVASKLLKSRQNTVDNSVDKEPSRKGSIKHTEETAAVMIQKQFRGYKTRKEYGPLLSHKYGKLDPTTAAFIQQYCKKWKAKTIFQVLLTYRAARYQDFVYFSQQVHLYNQKTMTGLQNSNNEAMSLAQVDPGGRASLMLPKKKPSVWKLPFRLGDVPFFDTTYMCDPLVVQGNKQSSVENDQECWDAPLRRSSTKTRRDHHLHLRDKEVQTSASPINEVYMNSEDNYIEIPYTRDARHSFVKTQPVTQGKQRRHADNVNKMPVRRTENSNVSNSGTSRNQFDQRDYNSNRVVTKEKQAEFKSYAGSNYPGSDIPRPYKVKPTPTPRTAASHDNSYHHDFDNNSSQSWNFPRSTNPSFKTKNEYNRHEESPTKKRRDFGKIKNPIDELKMKGRQINDDMDGDDPPFNFQAMLRKTNTNRASLRRGHEPQRDPDNGCWGDGGSLVYSSPQREDSPPPSYSRTSSANSWQGVEGERIAEELESVVNEAEDTEEDGYHGPEEPTRTELAPGIVVQGLVAEL